MARTLMCTIYLGTRLLYRERAMVNALGAAALGLLILDPRQLFMPAVLKNFRPQELWIGLLPPSAALESLVAEARALGVRVVRHWEGDQFGLGGAEVTVLFPPQDWPVGANRLKQSRRPLL